MSELTELSGELTVTISRDPESGWWRIVGPQGSGLYIAGPNFNSCLQDIDTSWRVLAEIAPNQIAAFPGSALPQL